MYPPSKITSKYIALFLLFALLLVFPFRSFIANLLVSFSNQRLIAAQNSSKTIEELEKKNLILSLALKKNQNLAEENEKLRKALAFKEDKNIALIGVEIASFDPSAWRRIAIINAGKDKGLREGMFAIDSDGFLVGRIVDVKNSFARLMLVDDPEFSVAVYIGKDALGLLSGGLDFIKTQYIDASDNVKLNDIVWFKVPLVSYPIYIGRVRKINENRNGLFLDVEVKLFNRNPLLKKVFILK